MSAGDSTFGDLAAAHQSWPSVAETYETFGDLTVADLADATKEMTVGEVAAAYPSVQALSENAHIEPKEIN